MITDKRRSVISRAVRRLIPGSSNWFRQGEFVTFKPDGFVRADGPGQLLCRNYHEARRIRSTIPLAVASGVMPNRSLEIGCGFGRHSPILAELFKEHYAVDINRAALAEAASLYPQVTFREASATALPFPNDYFDTVLTWTVLQHIPNHLIDNALLEIRRVAKRQSMLVLCESTKYHELDRPTSHTHDRSEHFYQSAFEGRDLLVSEFLTELDALPGLESPGRLMVFGPSKDQ